MDKGRLSFFYSYLIIADIFTLTCFLRVYRSSIAVFWNALHELAGLSTRGCYDEWRTAGSFRGSKHWEGEGVGRSDDIFSTPHSRRHKRTRNALLD